MSKSFSLEYIEHQLHIWTQAKEVWQRCEVSENDDLNNAIFKTYFRNPRGKTTKEIVNNLGYRLPSETLHDGKKISEKDVSEIIRTVKIDDKELETIVRFLLDNRTKLSFIDWVSSPPK